MTSMKVCSLQSPTFLTRNPHLLTLQYRLLWLCSRPSNARSSSRAPTRPHTPWKSSVCPDPFGLQNRRGRLKYDHPQWTTSVRFLPRSPSRSIASSAHSSLRTANMREKSRLSSVTKYSPGTLVQRSCTRLALPYAFSTLYGLIYG